MKEEKKKNRRYITEQCNNNSYLLLTNGRTISYKLSNNFANASLSWLGKLRKADGQPHYLACILLGYIYFFYQPSNSNKARYKGQALMKTTNDLASQFHVSYEVMSRALKFLEEQDLIKKVLLDYDYNGNYFHNAQYILLNQEKFLEISEISEKQNKVEHITKQSSFNTDSYDSALMGTVKEQIKYDELTADFANDSDSLYYLDAIAKTMVSVLASNKKYDLEKFKLIKKEHVKGILLGIQKYEDPIINEKAFLKKSLLSALFNRYYKSNNNVGTAAKKNQFNNYKNSTDDDIIDEFADLFLHETNKK